MDFIAFELGSSLFLYTFSFPILMRGMESNSSLLPASYRDNLSVLYTKECLPFRNFESKPHTTYDLNEPK